MNLCILRTSRRRFLLGTTTLAALHEIRMTAEGEPSAHGLRVRDLIRDPHFRMGFNLIAPEPGKRVVYGRLVPTRNVGTVGRQSGPTQPQTIEAGVPGDAIADCVWDLDQWSSRFPLESGLPAIPKPGVSRWANNAKSVTLGEPGTAETDLSLAVEGSIEYGMRSRKANEPWVHLLVEQAFEEPPSLSALTSARLRLQARLIGSNLHRTDDYSPDRHAAQFQMFLMLQNRNRESSGFGKLVWFGIPLYDDRSRFPKEHKQQDTGGTAMFIFTPGGEVFAERSAQDREWITVDKELRPLLLEALETAWQRGFLTESRDLVDYRITGMNLGWEVPGVFDVEMQVRGLGLEIRF